MKQFDDPAVASRRQERRVEILAATRALFDTRGRADAQIEDIATAVGINRAIIYRHFNSKEELFCLTLADYLDELRIALITADNAKNPAVDRLRAVARRFLVFGRDYPAFVECAQSLLRRPGDELIRDVSRSAMFRLGASISAALAVVVSVLEAGISEGEFRMQDPNLLANILYSQALGGLNLARLQLTINEAAPGMPEVHALSFDHVSSYLVEAAVAMARGAGATV